MKRIILKWLAFIALAGSIFIWPVIFPGVFSFTASGALNFKESPCGSLYPNTQISLYESGDLSYSTPLANYRKNTWVTDKYGYRNDPADKSYDLVVAGDSFAMGHRLDQNETLSEMLSRNIGMDVYNMGGADLSAFIADGRFLERHPKVLIYAIIERNINSIKIPEKKQLCPAKGIPKVLGPVVLIDKITKFSQFNFIYNKYLKYLFNPRDFKEGGHYLQNYRNTNLYNYGKGIFFFQDSIKLRDKNLEKLEEVSQSINTYNDFFKSKNIDLIIVVIPDKENIYNDLLPGEPKNPNVPSLLFAELNKNNVSAIDLTEYFKDAREKNVTLYFADDTHWTPQAVHMTAEIITEYLVKEGIWERLIE